MYIPDTCEFSTPEDSNELNNTMQNYREILYSNGLLKNRKYFELGMNTR